MTLLKQTLVYHLLQSTQPAADGKGQKNPFGMGKVATYGTKENSVNDALFFFTKHFTPICMLFWPLCPLWAKASWTSLYMQHLAARNANTCARALPARVPRAPTLVGIGIFEGTQPTPYISNLSKFPCLLCAEDSPSTFVGVKSGNVFKAGALPCCCA